MISRLKQQLIDDERNGAIGNRAKILDELSWSKYFTVILIETTRFDLLLAGYFLRDKLHKTWIKSAQNPDEEEMFHYKLLHVEIAWGI